METFNKETLASLKRIIFEDIEVDDLDKENMTAKQASKFYQLTELFSSKYVHDVHYTQNALEKLYFSQKSTTTPFLARKSLLGLIDNPRKHHNTNCLGSATYVSAEMQKLGIPHNILFFDTIDKEGYCNYHASIVYKYMNKLRVCDLLLNNRYTSDNNFFLTCPYEGYFDIYEKITGKKTTSSETVLIDPNIYPNTNSLTVLSLREWPLERIGFLTNKKMNQVSSKAVQQHFRSKFNNEDIQKRAKSKRQNCPN